MADSEQGLAGVFIAAVVAVGTAFGAWLKYRIDTAKDKIDEGLRARLQTRADTAEKRADALFDELQQLGEQRTEDARVIERLRSDLAHLTTDNTSLRRNLRRMAERLPPELRAAWQQALETDFAPLSGTDGS